MAPRHHDLRVALRLLGIVAMAAAASACPVDPTPPTQNGTEGSGGINLTSDGTVDGADGGGPKLDVADGGAATVGMMEAGGTGCDSELFGSEAVPPNVLIVLDRSGSMDQEIGGSSKWDIARDAIEAVTAAHQDDVLFGLMLFPGTDQGCNNGAECSPGAVFIDPDAMTADEIQMFLGGADTCSFGTPIAENLDALLDYPGLEDTTRANYILLVTDGMATCDDPVPKVTELRDENPEIKTFVVGFGSDVDPDQLTDMAVEGGTALAADPVYYQADDAAALSAAFDDIAGTVLSCNFSLDEIPDDPNELYVFFDMLMIDRDPTHTNGWDYDPVTNMVTFYGGACDTIKDDGVETVNIVFGCPELPPVG